MQRRGRLSLVGSDAIYDMPFAVQELARSALHAIDVKPIADRASDSFQQIEDLLQQCIDLKGESKLTGRRGDPRTWLIVLYMLIHSSHDELSAKWPSRTFMFEGKVHARTLSERMFAAVTLWRIDMAIAAFRKMDLPTAMAEIAIAGMAFGLSGSLGASELSELNQSAQRRKGADVRWANDPTQLAKEYMCKEWIRWQADRSLFKYPRDYRKAMLDRFPNTADGTVKNWMSEWAKQWKQSRC